MRELGEGLTVTSTLTGLDLWPSSAGTPTVTDRTACPECRQPIGARVPLFGVLAKVCGLLPRDA